MGNLIGVILWVRQFFKENEKRQGGCLLCPVSILCNHEFYTIHYDGAHPAPVYAFDAGGPHEPFLEAYFQKG